MNGMSESLFSSATEKQQQQHSCNTVVNNFIRRVLHLFEKTSYALKSKRERKRDKREKNRGKTKSKRKEEKKKKKILC